LFALFWAEWHPEIRRCFAFANNANVDDGHDLFTRDNDQ
jgi:hypothetical protein